MLGCGAATTSTPIEHPRPREPEPVEVTPTVEIHSLQAPISGAERTPDGDVEVQLRLGEDVEGSLESGLHPAARVRRAVFIPRGDWIDLELGDARVLLRGADAELVATWLETLPDLAFPEGERRFVEGSPMEDGTITVVESLWDARVRILGTLLLPDSNPWVRDAWATYELARRKPNGVERLIASYVSHRAMTGRALREDPDGALWACFCLDLRDEPPSQLESQADQAFVLDVDACLAHVDARIVAHVVPIYDEASIRSFFRGATVEGSPPTVVRSPGPLRPGDVITHVRGNRLESLEQLGRHIGELEPRHRVSIALQRGERTIRMWLQVPSLEVVREQVVFEILPDPSGHPAWPFAEHVESTP